MTATLESQAKNAAAATASTAPAAAATASTAPAAAASAPVKEKKEKKERKTPARPPQLAPFKYVSLEFLVPATGFDTDHFASSMNSVAKNDFPVAQPTQSLITNAVIQRKRQK